MSASAISALLNWQLCSRKSSTPYRRHCRAVWMLAAIDVNRDDDIRAHGPDQRTGTMVSARRRRHMFGHWIAWDSPCRALSPTPGPPRRVAIDDQQGLAGAEIGDRDPPAALAVAHRPVAVAGAGFRRRRLVLVDRPFVAEDQVEQSLRSGLSIGDRLDLRRHSCRWRRAWRRARQQKCRRPRRRESPLPRRRAGRRGQPAAHATAAEGDAEARGLPASSRTTTG